MSGYAALVSLLQILETILDPGGLRIYQNKAQLESLYGKVILLLKLLKKRCRYEQNDQILEVESKMREAAYKAQDVIEIQMSRIGDPERRSMRNLLKFTFGNFLKGFLFLITVKGFLFLITVSNTAPVISYTEAIPYWIQFLMYNILASGVVAGAMCTIAAMVLRVILQVYDFPVHEAQALCRVLRDFDSIEEDMKGEMSGYVAASVSSRRDSGGHGRNVVVGHESDLQQIKARLLQDSSKLEVISIVGMGGIGKTTLASLVYHDPGTLSHFDIRAWVTVSQEYSLRCVLLSILDSAKLLTKEMQKEDDDILLGVYLHQSLISRRYLIVMDDVWETQIWDSIRTYFPENDNQSRILVTSRQSDVASYPDSSSPLHQMHCLNDEESWYLLREKVFGEQDCPLELESIGREIARRCRGLPLAVVVIGGVLYKDNQSEIWRDVALNLSTKLRQPEEQCLEILGLSYKHLPHKLRPCFLYMGVFPEDCEIPVSRLISLWVAEGFLKPRKSKSLEEVAEKYLKRLIDRNLILVCKRSCNGKIRTCRIHDLLRVVSMQNAQNENFLNVLNLGGYVNQERPGRVPRRLSISTDAALEVNASPDLIVRSFLCIARKLLIYPSVVYLGFLYLRVLDVLQVHFGEFPEQIVKLLLLRYLAFHSDAPLPPSISNLYNLETLIHHHCSFLSFPRAIWSMPNLRHFYVKPGCYMSGPLGYRLPWKSSILEHLQTLMGIRNFKWSKGIIERLPKLKKLGIWYDVSSSVDWSKYELECLVNLQHLETLKITIKYDDLGSASPCVSPKLAFPQKLEKLSLSGCGIPWTMIGALPNLKALKLRCNACSGTSWETGLGKFPKLIYLLLEQISFKRWETDASHLPSLQRLVLRSCGMLEEIPCAIGDIPTLEMIDLVDCLPSAVDSAKQIQQDQQSMGNEDLIVRIALKGLIP